MTSKPSRAAAKLLVACGSFLVLSGCLRGCDSRRPPIHLNPDMDLQPKYRPQSESRFFYTGSTTQAPVPGTIARGELNANEAFYTGKNAEGFFIENPRENTDELLARGKERFRIFCTPCHGATGDGRGMLYQRSQIESTNLLEDRFRGMPDGQIFDLITNGIGLMQGYRYPVPPQDRWAIVAFLRTLQLER